MPVTLAPERDDDQDGTRRIVDFFLRYRVADVLLAVWAATALLIGAHVILGPDPVFLGAFDVSVAPF